MSIGIDFGTTNTVIALARPGKRVYAVRFPDDGGLSELYRSVLCFEHAGRHDIEATMGRPPSLTPAQRNETFKLNHSYHCLYSYTRCWRGYSCIGRRRPQTFSISSICAPSGAETQHTCRPLLTRSSRICAPFFLKFARAPA